VKKELAQLQRHRMALQEQLRQLQVCCWLHLGISMAVASLHCPACAIETLLLPSPLHPRPLSSRLAQVSIDAYQRLLARSAPLDSRCIEHALQECERLVAEDPSPLPTTREQSTAAISIRSGASTDSELPTTVIGRSPLVPLGSRRSNSADTREDSLVNVSPPPIVGTGASPGRVQQVLEQQLGSRLGQQKQQEQPTVMSAVDLLESSDGLRELRRVRGHGRTLSMSSTVSTSSSRLVRVAAEDRRSFQTPELARAVPGVTLVVLFPYKATDVRPALRQPAACMRVHMHASNVSSHLHSLRGVWALRACPTHAPSSM